MQAGKVRTAGGARKRVEELMRSGPGYKYNMEITFYVEPLRELLYEPTRKENESQEDWDLRYSQWLELERAHKAVHLYPVPANLVELLRSLLLGLALIGLMWYLMSLKHPHDTMHVAGHHHACERCSAVVVLEYTPEEMVELEYLDTQATLAIITGIIAFTLFLKKCLSMAEEAVPRQMHGVLSQIYEEFTVLVRACSLRPVASLAWAWP